MKPSNRTCPVVGLGASAGGLEAFRQFLSAVPERSGLAYVLVQHLDPNHESLLPELLARCTPLPVRHALDGTPIEPDHVYLVPPNANLEVADSHIRLTPFAEPRGLRRPIDTFFKSLATDQRENSAGIVLSGTGSDGTAGLRAVKEAGGLTLAQSPHTSGYDGMPSSAISTGLVDHILPPARMPGVLIDYFAGSPRFAAAADAEVTDCIRRVCEIVNDRLGHDFRNYKRSTLFRRIQRRMHVVGATSPEDYVNRLMANQAECEHLFRDILINVTGFFRDPAAFQRLAEIVLPAILEDRSGSDPVRIWVPGCSSGEEAFSLAMLFAEALEERRDRPDIQIFATDIDEQMLAIARSGRYPESIAKEVPPHLLAKYASAEEGRYQLVPAIRDMVRFSPHSLIKDPPFSRIDLISCRNLMIYFDSEIQDRLISLFHYALVPQGFLFLGPSENIHQRADLFEPVDQPARIFKRRRAATALPVELTTSLTGWHGRHQRAVEAPAARGNRFAEPGLRRVFEKYAPAHVVVDQRGEVRFSSGRLAKYLDFVPGEPSLRLMELARPDLRRPLREGLHLAAERGHRFVSKGLEVRGEIGSQMIDLIVDPLEDGATLVVFSDAEELRKEIEEDAAASHDLGEPEARLAMVEDELARTREQLRTTVEELETSNEELKSSNEEMMSMNEELQSTNEELATANDELKTKIDELAEANSDLQNFIESTSVATILLDRHLRLRSFTPAATQLFRIIDKDRGRPLLDVTARFDTQGLEEELRGVLRSISPVEREMQAQNGRSYILKLMPYRTVNDLIDGLVLTFTDVTSVKQAQQALSAANQRYEAATKASGHLVFDWDLDADRTLITGEVTALTGRNGETLSGPLEAWLRIIHSEDRERVGSLLRREVETGEPVRLEYRLVKPDGTVSHCEHRGTYFSGEAGRRFIGFVIDIGHRVELEERQALLVGELQHRVKNILATVLALVRQSARGRTGVADYQAILSDRIQALARTQDLLTESEWLNASLEAILQGELAPYVGTDHPRAALDGQPVLLPARAALSMAMALHELTTNAVKYGALSVSEGKVEVRWRLIGGGQTLILDWVETGGPVVPPTPGSGFGRTLLERGLAHELGGEVSLEFSPEGVRCRIIAPLVKPTPERQWKPLAAVRSS